MMTWKKKSKTFLKTNEAKNIIWLDYCGYHLTENISDLTLAQTLFITKGRMDLHKEMNKAPKKK